MLDTPAFRARQREVLRAFGASKKRLPAHAGGAYHDDPGKLSDFIETECLAKAKRRRQTRVIRGLTAPHMVPLARGGRLWSRVCRARRCASPRGRHLRIAGYFARTDAPPFRRVRQDFPHAAARLAQERSRVDPRARARQPVRRSRRAAPPPHRALTRVPSGPPQACRRCASSSESCPSSAASQTPRRDGEIRRSIAKPNRSSRPCVVWSIRSAIAAIRRCAY